MTREATSTGSTRKTADLLLRWYDRHRRDLPWRRHRDPYAIWVSEIMLQQTRVETGRPYFERFLRRFPGIEDLAAAEQEEVLALWSGLGYYRRARDLHRAAREIVTTGGVVPRCARELQQLPGIGRYTAAAIASIAFGEVVPAVDGNIARVVTRFRGISGDPTRGKTKRKIEATAHDLLDHDRPGDSNQALMELGATLCRPREPRCGACPLESDCVASRTGSPEAFPTPRRRPEPVRVERQVAVVRNRNRVLLARRDEASRLLAGLWELPWVDRIDGRRPEGLLAERYGGSWSGIESIGAVRHTITNRSFRIEIVAASLHESATIAEGPGVGWFDK